MKKLLLWGCSHAGAKAANTAWSKQYADRVAKEDMDVILLGDLFECATPSKGAMMFEQNLVIDEQLDQAVDMFRPIKHRIKGCVTSNHSERAYREAGVNLDRRLIRELGLSESLYKGHHGVVVYKGYRIVIAHGMGSGSNSWGDAERLLKIYPEADCIAVSHKHSLDASWKGNFKLTSNGSRVFKPILYIRTGSLMEYPRYAGAEAYSPQKPGFAVIEFDDNGMNPDIAGI